MNVCNSHVGVFIHVKKYIYVRKFPLHLFFSHMNILLEKMTTYMWKRCQNVNLHMCRSNFTGFHVCGNVGFTWAIFYSYAWKKKASEKSVVTKMWRFLFKCQNSGLQNVKNEASTCEDANVVWFCVAKFVIQIWKCKNSHVGIFMMAIFQLFSTCHVLIFKCEKTNLAI